MSNMRGLVGAIFVAVATIGGASAARAEYFVRPVLQYYGGLEDGLSRNDLTSNSATFNDGFTHLEAYVDLSDGTIKTYLEMNGPTGVFAGATGVMGDQIRYTGSSDDAVTFRYDYDSLISAYQEWIGEPPPFDSRFIAIDAHFAIYEAGSGATWDNWTQFGSNASKALYVGYERANFEDEGGMFDLSFSGSLGTDLFLTSGKSYDVFAAFNLLAVPGSMVGSITMNSLNTSTIGIVAPAGTLTSQSGAFLGLPQTPNLSAVPEPAAWAMMVLGFGLVGSAARRSRQLRTA